LIFCRTLLFARFSYQRNILQNEYVSDRESSDYKDYGSDYESDGETSTIETSSSPKIEEQNFDTKYFTSFLPKRFDKWNFFISAKDISNIKASMEDIHTFYGITSCLITGKKRSN